MDTTLYELKLSDNFMCKIPPINTYSFTYGCCQHMNQGRPSLILMSTHNILHGFVGQEKQGCCK